MRSPSLIVAASLICLFQTIKLSNAFVHVPHGSRIHGTKSVSTSSFQQLEPLYQPQQQYQKQQQLSAKSSDNDGYGEALQRNKLRTCIEQFLTQRSIQSFMFLCTQVRDPHTADWIERFLDSNNLLEYHGTGAFNMTRFDNWDTFFLQLMEEPKAKIIIQAKRRGNGHGGWSKNNPYLKDRFIEFEVMVDPDSLVPRIMSVREQIAKEFINDLDLAKVANEQIFKSYETKVQNGQSPDGLKSAFDKNAMDTLMNNMAIDKFASSPFRKGSFDLLILLSLHESIHRVLREYKDMGETREVSFAFLREFFVERLESHFDGNVAYSRGDDFIEEMLLTSPSVRTHDGCMELIDPLSIAADIINTRSQVLQDWKVIMEAVPGSHISLRKKLLTKQMGGWGQDATESQDPSLNSDIGAFE